MRPTNLPYSDEFVTNLIQTIYYVHKTRSDDLCWMDLLKIFAAAGLPTPDCRVGDKFAMLKNCVRFVDMLQAGGPWKSYAELMDWVKFLANECEKHGNDYQHTTDKTRLADIQIYIRQWFDTKKED